MKRKFNDMLRNDEKSMHFEKRTAQHIARVKSNAAFLGNKFPEISIDLLRQVNAHDDSKFVEPEYKAYVEITWKYKCIADGTTDYVASAGIEERMHVATLHHIRHNKHHPEFWDPDFSDKSLNSSDRDAIPETMINGTMMNRVSIAEMAADWVSMAQEKENSNSAYAWAKKTVNKRWKFTDEQVGWLFEFLDALVEM